MHVGVVGATGMVGTVMRQLLAERRYPLTSLRLFASARSAGSTVEWNGKTITIDSDDYTCESLATAIAANSAANALVSATATDSGNDDTVLPDDLASTRLTGGAQLMVYSQEFGMEVLLGDAVVEKHNYLSMVPTSSKVIPTGA